MANELDHTLRTSESVNAFKIRGNIIINQISIKCRHVNRSVLASVLYAMANGIDIAVAIIATLNIHGKRLMVDIMTIRKSYECRELSEIRQINGDDNPTDAMIKVNPTKALETLIKANKLKIRVKRWVKRDNSQ